MIEKSKNISRSIVCIWTSASCIWTDIEYEGRIGSGTCYFSPFKHCNDLGI